MCCYPFVLSRDKNMGIEYAESLCENKSESSSAFPVWACYMPPRLILRLGVPLGTSLFFADWAMRSVMIQRFSNGFSLFSGLLLIGWLYAAPGLTQAHFQEVSVSTARFRVEIAQTLEERQRGLMFRTQLAADQGMLFVQPTPGQANFWMKNTYIPLDMLYFNDQGQLLEVHTDVPPCKAMPCPVYKSRTAQVKYILEIN
ncbi:MAG: DUF192 domain-containing protein, partial [Candidatus Competibacteraceae bacterium]